MAKRSATLETTLIAVELLRRIPRNRRVTASELHEQLSNAGIVRDLRTIQRQLEALSEHFDIECDTRTKPYGYRWKAHSSGLSLPGLSEQEALVLLLVGEHLHHLLPGSVMKSMDAFFEQARSQMGQTAANKPARQWLKKVRVIRETQPTLPPRIEEGVFDAVSNALFSNLWLDVDYCNAAGKSKSACVMPLGLAQQGVRLYLVCRYENYSNERILALHRIQSACVTTRGFEPPMDFDLERYDGDGKFSFGDGKRVRLSFRVDAEIAFLMRESPLAADQREIVDDQGVEFSVSVVETVQLHRWLRGFGEKVWDVRLTDESEEIAEANSLRHILS